ncbi:integrin beta-like protein C [Amphiura filiformis]|uniref:integrin beta-like protein C n=1 Tax=Amphiura filiformis TaxID=82378 RepID=UPI003B21E691
MGTDNPVLRLLWLLCFLYYVGASHFRGGLITWAPVYNQPKQITVTWRLSWNRASVACDQTTIDTNALIGSGSICEIGPNNCFGAQTYCNDFNVVDNWSSGTFVTTFTATSTSFVLQYFGNAWISLSNGGGNWDLRSHVNLTPRPVGRPINTSPTTSISPVVIAPPGTTNTIHIPTIDADGDHIRCRWATGESGGVTQPLTSVLSLDPLTCTITFTSSGIIWGVALYIEDFLTSDSTTPLSTVPLQFLIQVKALPAGCTTTTATLIAPAPAHGSQIVIDAEVLYTAEIHGKPASGTEPIIQIATISPRGMIRSTVMSGNGNNKYVTINWTPELSQGGPNIFCFSVSDRCQSSHQWCVTLMVQLTCDPECVNGGVCAE